MELDPDSLERLVPADVRQGDTTGEETLRLHLERYDFASRFIRPGRLLDMACGVGYGTRHLYDLAQVDVDCLGVDVSSGAIEYASSHYAITEASTEATTEATAAATSGGAGRCVRYRCADAMTLEDPDGFDTIVSIETIEHLPDPVGFVARVAGLLRPGGTLVASVPTTPSVDANPHHLHDFSERSFRALFTPHGLCEVEAFRQSQPFSLGAVVTRSETRMQQVRSNLPAYYLRNPSALVRRVGSTLRHGFKNVYLTIAWRAEA